MNYTSDNPPFVVMPDGVWHLFSVPFKHNGISFEFHIYARNLDDARARVSSIRYNAGEPDMVVRLPRRVIARDN